MRKRIADPDGTRAKGFVRGNYDKRTKISYEKLAGLLGYAKASEVYIHYGELIENSTEIASYINDQFTVLYRSI